MYYNYHSELANVFSAMAGMFIFMGIIWIAVLALWIVAMWKMFEKAGEPGWAALVPFYNLYVLFKISWGNGWYSLLYIVTYAAYLIVYIGFFARMFGGLINGGFENFNDEAFMASMVSSLISLSFIMFFISMGILAVNIILCIKLAKVYGQGGGFACGLFFLGIIFYCIIAFSKNIRYVGLQGNAAPSGGFGGQPGNWQPGAPNGYPQQGYQNPYYQPNGNPQWGYQNPYYQPNGYQATPQQPIAPNPEGFNQQAAAPSAVLYCTECGTRLENNEKICPKCGKEQ